MEKLLPAATPVAQGAEIIKKAESVGLDPKLLYEAVIDLSTEGLLTANCINIAAGIILADLGLPRYFFENIQSDALEHLLQSIATSIKVIDGTVTLYGRVANIDFDMSYGSQVGRVRIATEETRENMEAMLEDQISGHRREYYYSPDSKYSTYIIRPETVVDYSREEFLSSRFLFSLAGDYAVTPEPTRKRYESFLVKADRAVVPHIEVFNLPETGETRLMFGSDFEKPQLPLLRKLLAEHGFTLVRAYWEPYLTKASVPSSVCALYIQGELTRTQEARILADLRSFLSYSINSMKELYLNGELTFHEMLFAGNAIDFTHLFIYKESENATDREILESLSSKDHQDAFSKRLHSSNKSIYAASLIEEMVKKNVDLLRFLHELFERKFKPGIMDRLTDAVLQTKWKEFDKMISARFIDFSLGYDIFKFMFKIVSATLKTNFYKEEKRSFSFRFDSSILDPLVYNQFVYGIFYVNGHYACGTHLRAADIARGGLRLLRISRSNHATELDNAVLLNYALGPKAQRLKHKDICESGSKGVVVPHPQYASYSRDALFDYTEGIMDLMLLDNSIIDYYGKPELIFFGPDEGTAPLMDGVSLRAKERGYRHWRTMTTGKSFGIPHDTYGLLESGELFGLLNMGADGVDLQVDGKSVLLTNDMEEIYAQIGGKITLSGMTTTSIMSAFRTLIESQGHAEENLNLMITGGPDGDLGANEIQCYQGKICLILDGGSVLFDPEGLDKKELMKIAFMRNGDPRANSLAYPEQKLGARGFRVPLRGKNVSLPDGTVIEDGALFHKTFLANVENRKFIREANITAFIPCGGFKDTINHGNVKQFLELFKELKFIVEGANVFFDDVARRHIAIATDILQIKDSSANKGGVFSSSVSEVLTAFLLQDEYEEKLLNDVKTRWALIRDIMNMVARYAAVETLMLMKVYGVDPMIPLFDLSEKTSEKIFAFQDQLLERKGEILADEELVWKTMEQYVPPVLIGVLGREHIMTTFKSEELGPYLDAIVTKKLASMAYYRFCLEWDTYLEAAEVSLVKNLHHIFDEWDSVAM
ncbi:NAD-glutamate dehydrogenase domain-containing protein [Desulfopila aestuarii]|uniref:Glutamate dehydrogenase n=1 Tax=Desulfopila aestuarii DSM 18488 TaxID=1121416 RepID=A0A1M7YC50_9BACT|nr:NAD-glutamate dehydrogenase domain-containing protein [Desulfopila aestuarii]SHO50171.1 glutamate dehydrogenase [Desulfopila aestuarii DSM 18488]